MKQNQDKIKEILERMEQSLEAIHTNEDWLQFLVFQSKFYQYSFRNTMLIYAQNPEASYVKGFKAWNKLGRYVKKGSKGLAILAPCFVKVEEKESEAQEKSAKKTEEEKRVLSGFKVTYVFDIADTAGSEDQLPVLVRGLSGNSEQEQELYEKLKDVIGKEHKIQEIVATAAKGWFDLTTGIIAVREDMDYLQKIKTLLHEYAHAVDFTMHPDSEEISRNKRELIAESVAFVVSSRLGLDTSSYSVGYVQSWLQDKNELKQVADNIQKVSATILNKLAKSSDFASFMLQEDEEV